jgi:rare lipoprotein A
MRVVPRISPRSATAILVSLAIAFFISGCAKKKKPAVAKAARIGATEQGIASWYGYPYHGRAAANGEIYDMEKLTAAHRTLPFGTWVEVANLENEKRVTVRITDRGPFVHGRVIDLSKAAARDIDMLGPGLAKVRLTVVSAPRELPAVSLYAVQVGAFQDKRHAERLRRDLEKEFGPARIVLRAAKTPLWRVLVGEEPSMEAANGLAERLRAAGRNVFVVRLDEPETGSGATH